MRVVLCMVMVCVYLESEGEEEVGSVDFIIILFFLFFFVDLTTASSAVGVLFLVVVGTERVCPTMII